jgi:nitrile hydratase
MDGAQDMSAQDMGAQDMGGVPGFGPVKPEPNEPVFHAPWERRVLAMTLAMAKPGGWNIDMSRFARENRPHKDYLSKSYYEIWLAGLERLMLERNMIAPAEIEAGHALHPPKPGAAKLTLDQVAPTLRRGTPTQRDADTLPLFQVGDRVRAKSMHPATHTRLPRYVRGHLGTIERLHGSHVFPDTHAAGQGEQPQWLYTVCFDGRELWGDDANASTMISVDAWESYLERA